mgnify:CR=1 FL=1|jgi:hypothetical protein
MVAINRDFDDAWQVEPKEIFGEYSRKQTDLKFEALYRSIEASFRGLEPFRNLNRRLVREYAGPAYGECETKRKYLNMTAQLVDAYTMLLAANRPKADVTTRFESLRPYANHFEIGLNNLIGEIGLEFTIRRWVLDAFFCVGIIKVHQKDAGEIQFEKNLWMDPGTPFASNVSLDNFVYDAGARSWGELRWAGDMYRVPLDDIKKGVEIGMYDPDVAKEIVPTSKYRVDNDKLESYSRGNEFDLDDFQPMVDLADVWVKRDRRIYTFVVTDRTKFCIKNQAPLASMEWDDPETGPYHILGFSEVPENIMPVGPAVHMDELDRLINNLLRKQARQAMRQKDATIYSPQGADTAKRWQKTPDGGMIQGDPTGIGKLTEGGANPQNQLFLGNIIEMYKNACGGLDTLRGTGAAAGTVGQEQLIHDASNRAIAQMQYRVMDATRRLLKSLAFMLWTDEFKEISGQFEVPGTDYAAETTWKPGDREGNFLDYNFDVNVFSMTYQPPAQVAAELMNYAMNVIVPLAPTMAQQGGMFNVAEFNNIMADLTGREEYKRMVTFTTPPSEEAATPSTRVKPPNTTRTYNRSIPSGTAQGAGTLMQQQWASMANSAGGASMTPAG